MKRILLVGKEELLLLLRARVLEKTGAEVVLCTLDAVGTRRDDTFADLLVLCHSVPADIATAVAGRTRMRWPAVKILQLVRYDWDRGSKPQYADALAASIEPENVVTTATWLLGHSQLEDGGLDATVIPSGQVVMSRSVPAS